MRCCVAIDGGGSKTEIVLFDETGHILRRHVGQGGNATDIGPDLARQRVLENLEQVMPYAPAPVAALYGGIAGGVPNGDIYSEAIGSTWPVGSIRVEDNRPHGAVFRFTLPLEEVTIHE